MEERELLNKGPQEETKEEEQSLIDELTLFSGEDILVEELSLILNQPKLREIAQLGESTYVSALSTINFDKNRLEGSTSMTSEELAQTTNFQWIMVLISRNPQKYAEFVLLLSIIFKQYDVYILKDPVQKLCTNIALIPKDIEEDKREELKFIIDDSNYEILKKYLNEIFYMSKKNKSNYNTDSKAAEAIAKKLEEGRQKVAAQKKKSESSVLCNAISSYAVGQKIDVSDVFEKYTLYQFYVQLHRSRKYDAYTTGLQALFAGAQDIELDSWQEDL